jgi:hypothetical protein
MRVLTHLPYCVFIKPDSRKQPWELVARCKNMMTAYEVRDYFRQSAFAVEVKLEVGGKFA